MTRTNALSGTLAVALFATVVAAGQMANPGVVLSVNDPRPMARMAELLEQRYGIPICYEDVAYSFPGDLIDKADAAFRSAHPNAKFLIPRGGRTETRVNTANLTATDAAISVIPAALQIALEAHVAAGNPGSFKLVQINGTVVILPTSVRNAAGISIPDQSPLDVPISFTKVQRTGMQTMETICGAVTAASGKAVVIGTVPYQALEAQVVNIGAANEVARSVLLRMFANLQWSASVIDFRIPQMSWQLFYGPDVQAYALNVHQVMIAQVSPLTGKRKLHVVYR